MQKLSKIVLLLESPKGILVNISLVPLVKKKDTFVSGNPCPAEFINRKKHMQRIGTVKDRNTIFRSFLFKDKKLLLDFA